MVFMLISCHDGSFLVWEDPGRTEHTRLRAESSGLGQFPRSKIETFNNHVQVLLSFTNHVAFLLRPTLNNRQLTPTLASTTEHLPAKRYMTRSFKILPKRNQIGIAS